MPTKPISKAAPTALGHELVLDKETKNYAKFVPAAGDRALGALYVPVDDWKAIGSPETVLVSIEAFPTK